MSDDLTLELAPSPVDITFELAGSGTGPAGPAGPSSLIEVGLFVEDADMAGGTFTGLVLAGGDGSVVPREFLVGVEVLVVEQLVGAR